MANLQQKVALVTGSTKGIGHAIASAFIAQGTRVILHGRDAEHVHRASRGSAPMAPWPAISARLMVAGASSGS